MGFGRQFLAPVAAAALVVSLSACGDRTPRDPFVIGYVAAFSSERTGVYDREALSGARYEAARLNSKDGIAGRPIEIVTVDITGDPASGGAAARDLISEGVDVLFAAPLPDYSDGVVAAAAEADIPALSVGGTIPSIVASGAGMAFLNGFGDNVQATAAAQAAIDSGHRRALMVSTGDITDYGDTLPVYFAEAFRARGGDVVGTVDVGLDEAPRFDRVRDALAALSQPPDLVYTAITPPWLNDLLVALRSEGYDGVIYGADGAETAELLEAGSAAEGMVLTAHAFASSRPAVGLLFSPRSPSERIAQFVDGFERFHGQPPESLGFAALGADAVGVVHAAASRSDSTGPGGLAAAIADLDRVQVTTGRVTFRGNGAIPVKVVYVLEVRDGAFRLHDVVEPTDVPDPIE
jgi:branched-chain amino acid transport system substrate-binding protein